MRNCNSVSQPPTSILQIDVRFRTQDRHVDVEINFGLDKSLFASCKQTSPSPENTLRN